MHSYVAHGLLLETEVVLPDMHPAESDTTAVKARTVIRLGAPRIVPDHAPAGDVIVDHRSPGRRWYVATRDGAVLRLRMPGMADFILTNDLTSVRCHPDPSLPPDLLGVLLSGNVLAFALAVGGVGVLHASAVDVAGSAIAIVGPSNAGKSTMAALLCLVGARLVADDLVCVDPAQTTVRRGGRELRLRPAVADVIGNFGSNRPTADGRYAVRPPPTRSTVLPLRSVVTLRRASVATPIIARQVGAPALLTLLSVPRTLGWCDAAPVESHFAAMSRIVETTPVHAIDLPLAAPLDRTVASQLLALLDGDTADATPAGDRA